MHLLLLLRPFTYVYFIIVKWIFKCLNFFSPRIAVPPPTDPLLLMSAKKAAKAIRERTITSESLVLAYIKRIHEVDHMVNGLVEERFADALNLARCVDFALGKATSAEIEEIARRRPFLGVPVTVKECIEVEGYKCTYGVLARKDYVSDSTAPAVDRLREAGCILLGKTNVPEICLSFFTTNTIYGTTSNPYDTRRTSGGSSGGEGALIGAGASVIGLGSDIGGSIRFPAHFNGIFGLKTSVGLIDIGGHLPVISEFRLKMLSLGPICRYAEDLEGMTRVMAGANVDKIKLGQLIEEGSIRLFYMCDLGSPLVESCCSETLDTIQSAVSALEKRFGVAAEEIHFEHTNKVVEMIGGSLHCEKQMAVKRILTDGAYDISPIWEMLKLACGKSDYTFSTLFTSIVEEWNDFLFTLMLDKKKEKFRAARDQLTFDMKQLLGQNGFIICPTYPTPAPFHNHPPATMFNFAWAGMFNMLGLPAVQCPVGVSSEGMPIGIVGPEFSDGTLIKLAEEMEQSFGGWRCMQPIDN